MPAILERFFGDDYKLAYLTGSGPLRTFGEIAQDLVQPGHDLHVRLQAASDPPDVQERGSVLLAVVGVQPLRDQPSALDSISPRSCPAIAPRTTGARMPSPPGVRTTATVPNGPPAALNQWQTPRSSGMHTTLPGRFGRGQDCDSRTHPSEGDMVSVVDYLVLARRERGRADEAVARQQCEHPAGVRSARGHGAGLTFEHERDRTHRMTVPSGPRSGNSKPDSSPSLPRCERWRRARHQGRKAGPHPRRAGRSRADRAG
jgi:hypothetical protein